MADKSQLTACKSPEVVIVGGSDKCHLCVIDFDVAQPSMPFDVAQPIKPKGLRGGAFGMTTIWHSWVRHQ